MNKNMQLKKKNETNDIHKITARNNCSLYMYLYYPPELGTMKYEYCFNQGCHDWK